MRFEPKVKTFLRLITFIDGVKDSVQYFLKFQGADTTGPIEPPPTYELKKPSIHVENGFDIHQGDTVLLKCSLLVPKVKNDNRKCRDPNMLADIWHLVIGF